MGCWSLPFNEKAVKKLEKLMASAIAFEDGLKKDLTDVYGDDDLFDEIDNHIDFLKVADTAAKLSKKPKKSFTGKHHQDARAIIAKHIKELIDRYDEDPDYCAETLTPELRLRILMAIDYETDPDIKKVKWMLSK